MLFLDVNITRDQGQFITNICELLCIKFCITNICELLRLVLDYFKGFRSKITVNFDF